MNEQDIEQAIQAKGLTAPRVTPADIEANIASEHYFTSREGVLGMLAADGVPATAYEQANAVPQALGLLTFCVLVLRNGFTVTGESACASPENFDAELGRKIARQNAVQKIWPLMGYALRERLAAAPKAGDWLSRLRAERHEVAERLAKLREFMAAPKGNPTPRQLALLAKQERAMSDYVWAMDDRIADAEAPE